MPTLGEDTLVGPLCGVRMLCACCHAHPLENETQTDYYGLASFFRQRESEPAAFLGSHRVLCKSVSG